MKSTALLARVGVLVFGAFHAASLLRAAMAAPVGVHWLDGAPPPVNSGVSWGVPWPRGAVPKGQAFTLTAADGTNLPLQSWPMAYWPDGSLKWSGFATTSTPGVTGNFTLSPSAGPAAATGPVLQVTSNATTITINTGPLVATLSTSGGNLVDSLAMNGNIVAAQGQLVSVMQNAQDDLPENSVPREKYIGRVMKVTVEQAGPVRAVVKIEGTHQGAQSGREWLLFNVRLYFYAGETSVRMVHTIFWDGDQNKDFVKALGVTFTVPLREEMQNRHVRFSGADGGLWAEPIQPLAGRPGANRIVTWPQGGGDVYPAQLNGERVPNHNEVSRAGAGVYDNLAIWNDFKLSQLNDSGFTIHKRTNPQSTWLFSAAGKRASGLAFVGDVSGGLAVSIRNFWQSFPTGLEIRGAATPAAQLTAWLWSPEAVPMDMRHYDIRAHGLENSYEDVQEGFSLAYGVARTSELTFYATAGVPAKEETVKMAAAGGTLPLLVCTPEYISSTNVLGLWSPVDRSTPFKIAIEDRLDTTLKFYMGQPDERSWYGYWYFGNIMHSYDAERHVWRYDNGGHAWDNTELGVPLWLWYSFLRSGRADVFRFAEALTRNNSETVVYHFGPFAGLGTRHNVIPWGDGAKEARISQSAHWRPFYYLTTDERTGDLMTEVTHDAPLSAAKYDPMRVAQPPTAAELALGYPARLRVGPDWFAIAGDWMTEWERSGDTTWRDKIYAGMDSLAALPNGVSTGRGLVVGFDPVSGKLFPIENIAGSANLANLQGGPEVIFEMNELIDHPAWQKIWLEYCARVGTDRLTSYLQSKTQDAALLQTASAALSGRGGARGGRGATDGAAGEGAAPVAEVSTTASTGPRRGARTVEGPLSLNVVTEGLGDTNSSSQNSLTTIEILALAKDILPREVPPPPPNGPGRGRRGARGATPTGAGEDAVEAGPAGAAAVPMIGAGSVDAVPAYTGPGATNNAGAAPGPPATPAQ